MQSVITSYSIHYTKLYEWSIRRSNSYFRRVLWCFNGDRCSCHYVWYLICLSNNYGSRYVDAVRRGINRITSYNVCYTKLLRSIKASQYSSKVAVTSSNASFTWSGHMNKSVKISDIPRIILNKPSGPNTNATTGFRITSYNVCYTKLLRNDLVFIIGLNFIKIRP